MPAALAVVRFVHFAATTGLFGLSLFNLYAPPAKASDRGRGGLVALAVLALLSGLAWLILVTANLAGSIDAEALKTVVFEFPFGQVWAVRMLIAMVALGVSLIAAPRTLAVVAAVLLASIALTGHTQTHEGALRLAHEASDALHLLGAGAWLGGLAGLLITLRRPNGAVAAKVGAFSKMGYAAVGAIVASGLFNAWLLVGDFPALIGSSYGRLLLGKLALFAGMLALALVNRFLISPALAGDTGEDAAGVLWRSVRLEAALGLTVLAVAAWLGLGQPPAA